MAIVTFVGPVGRHTIWRGFPIIGNLIIPLLCFSELDLTEPVLGAFDSKGIPVGGVTMTLPDIVASEIAEEQELDVSIEDMEDTLEWMPTGGPH